MKKTTMEDLQKTISGYPLTRRLLFAPKQDMDETVLVEVPAVKESDTLCFTFEELIPSDVERLVKPLRAKEVFISDTYPNVVGLTDRLRQALNIKVCIFSIEGE